MNPVMRFGARSVGAIFSTAYTDLLLDSPAVEDLCSEESLRPLARCRHRILYACSPASNDQLVSLETGGLTVPIGDLDTDTLPPCVEGHPHVREALFLEPLSLEEWGVSDLELLPDSTFSKRAAASAVVSRLSKQLTKPSLSEPCPAVQSAWATISGYLPGQTTNLAVEPPAPTGPSRILMSATTGGATTASKIAEAVKLHQCVQAFHGALDEQECAERAAQMLFKLRSLGRWTLHVVDFPERFVLAHGAIIHHPSTVKNPLGSGQDVSMHLANTLCSVLREFVHPDQS